jgi:hypothetical protein
VENTYAIQEAFKFPRLGPFHRIDGMICFPLLIVALGWARLVRMAWELFLLLFLGVEGHLLDQGVAVGDGEHCFCCPRVLHGELLDLGQIPEFLLEEHDDRLVIDVRDDIPLIVEALNDLSEELSLLLDDTG